MRRKELTITGTATTVVDSHFYFGLARDILKKQGLTGDDLLRNPKLHMWLQRRLVQTYSRLQGREATPTTTTAATETCGDAHKEGGPAAATTPRTILHVFDRSAVDALVYTQRYGTPQDVAALQATPEFQSCLELYRNPQRALVVLFPVVPGLVHSDGMRIHGDVHEQKHMFDLFQTTLRDLCIPYVVLGTDLHKRGNVLLSQICSAAGITMKKR